MASRSFGGFSNGQLYQSSMDMSPMIYNNVSGESSASSASNFNGSNDTPNGDACNSTEYFCSIQNSPSVVLRGLIGVELDWTDDLYTDLNYMKSESRNNNTVAPHVLSRRRAQNRASQRAFRSRRKRQLEELEQRYSDLRRQHDDLTKSYESLQFEYSTVKQELETLRRGNIMYENVLLPRIGQHRALTDWEEHSPMSLDISLSSVSTFYNTYGSDEVQKKKMEQISNGDNINNC